RPDRSGIRGARGRRGRRIRAWGDRMKFFEMIAAATVAGAIALGGCRPAATGDQDSGPIDAVPATMSVAGARVSIAPMQSELRLLGVTAARRHITLRAPTA